MRLKISLLLAKFACANLHCTKMKFSIKDFFSKCNQIRRQLWISSHLLKKSLMEDFNFCAVIAVKLSDVNLLNY